MNEQTAFRDVFATETLAGLYFDQGAYREAAEIYKKLLAKNPSDLKSKIRLERALSRMEHDSVLSKPSIKTSHDNRTRAWRISYLEAWLDQIQSERRP